MKQIPGVLLSFCAICILAIGSIAHAVESRSFRMGFTSFPYAATIEAVNDTNAFVTTNADIISEQVDESIPWNEALHSKNFPSGFVKKMEERRARIAQGQKRVLYITPFNLGHNGLLPSYKDASHPAEASWESKRFDNSDVVTAYTNYCAWMVNFFKPDYLVMGIETNEYLKNVPGDWENYHVFSQHVHKEMKRLFPSLMLSESVTLHQLLDPKLPDAKAYTAKIKKLIAEQDFVAVSFHPFFLGAKSSADTSHALDTLREYSSKPIALIETGQSAETLDIAAYHLHFPLTPADQAAYMKTLLEHAQQDHYLFVIWWAHRDFDALWKTFPAEVKDLGRLWRDIGLLDENGKQCPAFAEWKSALAKSYRR